MTKKEKEEEENSMSVIIPYHKKDDYQNNEKSCTYDSKYMTIDNVTHHFSFSIGVASECLKSIVREQDLIEARERIKQDQQQGKKKKESDNATKKISSGMLYTKSDGGKKTVQIGENIEALLVSG